LGGRRSSSRRDEACTQRVPDHRDREINEAAAEGYRQAQAF
jgi:hypothetical protein